MKRVLAGLGAALALALALAGVGAAKQQTPDPECSCAPTNRSRASTPPNSSGRRVFSRSSPTAASSNSSRALGSSPISTRGPVTCRVREWASGA